MRWAPVFLSLLVAGCGQNDAATVPDRLFDLRRVTFEKPELLSSYHDGDAVVVVYTDQAAMNGVWIRYKCHPPVSDRRWFCEHVGDPTKNVILRP